uniref:Uncharacterized protein n=1 Tax=Proboscia inermis TaxID=420281 RepID=A0A7S0CGE2_9STRA
MQRPQPPYQHRPRAVPYVWNPTNPVIPYEQYPACIPFKCTASIRGCWRAARNVPFARHPPLDRIKVYRIADETRGGVLSVCVSEGWTIFGRERVLWNVTHTKIDKL